MHLWYEFQNPTSPASQVMAFSRLSENLTQLDIQECFGPEPEWTVIKEIPST